MPDTCEMAVSAVTIPTSEYEEMKNRIHNLNLYIAELERVHPNAFHDLIYTFDGLPGYSGREE